MRRVDPARSRTTVALAAAVTVAAVGAVGCGSAAQHTASTARPVASVRPAPAASVRPVPPANASVPVAQLVALARGSLTGLGGANVASARVVRTTKRAAEYWMEPGSVPPAGSNPPAYLVVLSGPFVCSSCTGPAGAPEPRGSSAQFIWIPGKGVSDFGLSQAVPTGLNRLGRVVKIHLGPPLNSHVIVPPPVRLRPATPSHALPTSPSHALRTSPSHALPTSPSHALPVTPSHLPSMPSPARLERPVS